MELSKINEIVTATKSKSNKTSTFENPYKILIKYSEDLEQQSINIDNILRMTSDEHQKYIEQQTKIATKTQNK